VGLRAPRRTDGTFYWTRLSCLDPGFRAKAVSSPAHTARVVLALLHCFQATDGKLGAAADSLSLQPNGCCAIPLGATPRSTSNTHMAPQGNSPDPPPYERLGRPSAAGARRRPHRPTHHLNDHGALPVTSRRSVDWRHMRAPVWATLDALERCRASHSGSVLLRPNSGTEPSHVERSAPTMVEQGRA
jgi:hypothetical protein